MTSPEQSDLGQKFSPGFRLSALDVLVLIVGAASAVYFGIQTRWIGLVIGFVVGHFFLFCNVFRMSRPLELIWAAVFLVLASGTIASDLPGWPIAIGLSLSVTVAVIITEMKKPSYHGIGWQKINPGLPDWWAAQARPQ